ncbi:MAG: hypothetical protein Q7J68_03745 [Thermoplasmata archaeon]|nr:hypothetical protein [Thermoplasmata archaeon]
MKIRSLKQVLHWVFLVVGIISLITLAFSISTYLDYAREGYGLDISLSEAWLNDDWLVVRVYIENPGGLDIELDGGNVTLGTTYAIPHGILPNGLPQNSPLDIVKAGKNTTIVIWVPIGQDDLANIRDTGMTDISLDLRITIPTRYCRTHLLYQATGVEVVP